MEIDGWKVNNNNKHEMVKIWSCALETFIFLKDNMIELY